MELENKQKQNHEWNHANSLLQRERVLNWTMHPFPLICSIIIPPFMLFQLLVFLPLLFIWFMHLVLFDIDFFAIFYIDIEFNTQKPIILAVNLLLLQH